ncbi:hypothetical protein TTHERM_00245260 (macronuclear) [Tetrahymena thermophila SB210]|uniref:Uncharacterized protein n=1 Tax=Tetrahymena thermophila (strain SB210) TaxID=312017 RepID=Q245X2_TETTS|nr:hypothetical protein TTHERM_00245260 [Tetrahymena thermophila SB210]EAS03511.2 hypothetical protein TTHERM_00245260 [Tetrahymena thermophila SB210]|eukprot:XP_001023756.2 hypothetical protein TTHERM_00245260 [Tetrahymena thermophila SB210]
MIPKKFQYQLDENEIMWRAKLWNYLLIKKNAIKITNNRNENDQSKNLLSGWQQQINKQINDEDFQQEKDNKF